MAKILFLTTEDWLFTSHFLDRALAAQRAGHEVVIAARESAAAMTLREVGMKFVPLPFDRKGINLLHEAWLTWRIIRLYATERPSIVHHIALKPIIEGTLAARLNGIRRIVNAPIGMGYVFTSGDLRARLLRPFVSLALRWLTNPRGSRVIVENAEDLDELVGAGMARREDVRLIRGAGVDLVRFRPSPVPAGVPIVLLVARMLYDKGIGEFVDASRLLQQQGVVARFLLAGEPDPGNPTSIPREVLERWTREGQVEWLGRRTDVAALMHAATIVCLPSYREGMPKSLLEALASGRPVVTTNVTGCREVVRDGIEGLLVPPRNPAALAAAVARLIEQPELRARFGAAGRARAEADFSTPSIEAATLAVYGELLAGDPA